MNQRAHNVDDIQELADEIQEFIDYKREPEEIIEAQVKKINPIDNMVTLELEEDFNFYNGALVVVNGTSGSVQDKYSTRLEISTKEELEFEVGDNVKVDSSKINLIINRLEKTINNIKKNNLDKNSQKTLQFVLGNLIPKYHKKNVNFKSQSLNIHQKEAIINSISADSFHLIIGPPGTGKTYVITEILEQLLLKGRKILITAWTNIAVDNILEKFQDNSPENILRIGSFKEVSPLCQKFTLEKRRKESKDWKEVEQLEKLIKNQKQAKHSLNRDENDIYYRIKDLEKKKKVFLNAIDSILETKEEYKVKALRYKTSNSKINDDLVNLDSEWSHLIKKSETYSNLAGELFNLEEWENSLPEEDVLYNLENDIKKERSKKIIKKIVSPFRRNNYKKFLEDLQIKETKYQNISRLYKNYRDKRDTVVAEYIQFYGNDLGNPYYDSLKCEIKLLNLMEKYLPIEIATLQEKTNYQNIIHESYQNYISSLTYNVDIIQEEIALLEEDIKIKNNLHDNILNEIEVINDLIEINQINKKKILEFIDNEILNKSNLIIATVISSAHPLLKEKFFDWMIMDEASQVASFMSLIPLLKTKRFLLVGDDKQLQPIEESGLSDHLNLSIFNRLLYNFPNSSTFLDTQYRMNEKLANIPSQLFYDGKLKTYPAVSKQTLDCTLNGDNIDIINPEAPLTYLDTYNLEYYEDAISNSCENSKEAELVVKLVNALHEEGISTNDIGIITPYRRHKNKIKNQLKEKAINVDVDTVYRFQGREKDVIILTFCNSKLGRLKPFLRKFIERPSQVNVSLTRARKKLYLVANSKTLKQSKLLTEIINLIGEENTIKCTDEILNIMK
jgi:superfamily I DNA and/or RNA helicase